MPDNQQLDPFGISKIYPTSAYGMNNRRTGGNGWEYYADFWRKQKIYEFVPAYDNSIIPEQTTDLYAHYKKVPNSFYNLKGGGGDGTLTLTSDEKGNPIQISVFDDNNLYYGTKSALNTGKRWTSNVEFTVYFNIKSYPLTNRTSLTGSGGISIHLCSDHHFIDYQHNARQNMTGFNAYNSHEYFLKMEYDGHMYLGGEPFHPAQRDKKPDNVYTLDFWDTNFKGIPLNTNIGIKFIKKIVNTKDVFLEVYRDMTNGTDGGTWVKLFEFLHTRGNWYNTTMDAPYAAAIATPEFAILPLPANVDDPHVDGGGGSCYLKLDPIHEIDLKYLSVRDIEPNLISPTTTDAELTSDSSYFDDNEADVL